MVNDKNEMNGISEISIQSFIFVVLFPWAPVSAYRDARDGKLEMLHEAMHNILLRPAFRAQTALCKYDGKFMEMSYFCSYIVVSYTANNTPVGCAAYWLNTSMCSLPDIKINISTWKQGFWTARAGPGQWLKTYREFFEQYQEITKRMSKLEACGKSSSSPNSLVKYSVNTQDGTLDDL